MATATETIVREGRYAVRAYFAPLVWLAKVPAALSRAAFRKRGVPLAVPPVPRPAVVTPDGTARADA